MVCISKLNAWLPEQPDTSLMGEHPRMKQLYDMVGFYTVKTWMGLYGAATRKRTTLRSTEGWLATLKLDMRGKSGSFSSAGICNTYVHGNGKKRTNGTNKLKQTQEYPASYAQALFDNHVLARPQNRMMDIKALDGHGAGQLGRC